MDISSKKVGSAAGQTACNRAIGGQHGQNCGVSIDQTIGRSGARAERSHENSLGPTTQICASAAIQGVFVRVDLQ